MKIERIDHLVITTACPEACLHFYTDILNLEADKSNGHWAVKFGNQKINIHRRKSEFLPAAHREGCAFLDTLYRIEIPARADIVLVSQGGAPKVLAMPYGGSTLPWVRALR